MQFPKPVKSSKRKQHIRKKSMYKVKQVRVDKTSDVEELYTEHKHGR